MKPVDRYPLALFKGRSISWTRFSLSKPVTVRVRVLDPDKVSLNGLTKILPEKCGLKPVVRGRTIMFPLRQPGQYSVEIGADGFKHGLLIFADPPQTNPPGVPADTVLNSSGFRPLGGPGLRKRGTPNVKSGHYPLAGGYYPLAHATPAEIYSVPAAYSGIYFRPGVHDIGVYRVPAHIKNIYLSPGAWVYGSIILDGHSGVKIFGRGVLSQAKLNYRQAHAVEAIHHSDNITIEGIVLADTKYYAIRLLGTNNTVRWVKVVGGWTYNTDGIAAFADSKVAHCFIRANDDSLKPYASNLTISDCVVWQLNNGAVIQLGWGNARATNVTIRGIDVLHAEWNNDAANRGILSCVGDKFAKGGMSGWHQTFLIENLTTETPVPFIFNIRPNPASPDQVHGLILKKWNIEMDLRRGYSNYIECTDGIHKFDGLVFDHFQVNGVELSKSNWLRVGRFVTNGLAGPRFVDY